MQGRRKKILAAISVFTSLALFGAGCQLGVPRPDSLKKQPTTTITYWSVFNESSEMAAVIQGYKKVAPTINVEYKKLEITNYENELLNALAQDRGPDIFSVNNTWVPKYIDKLEPIPESQSGIDQFVPVVKQVADINKQVYGLPLSVDTLALYYNPKIFNTAGIAQPPTTWDEFDAAIKKITQPDGKNFKRMGAAIGTANNINRGIDPLQLLMLQNGTQMTDDNHTQATFAHTQIKDNNERYAPGLVAFNKFLGYSKSSSPTYTWNSDQNSGFEQFAAGNVGMLFNYNYNYEKILNLNIGAGVRVVPVPQIAGTKTPVALANFWLEGVSKKSKQQLEAWKFIMYATGAQGAKLFTDATHKPAARKDLAEVQKSDRELGAFASQAAIATTWYQQDVGATETALTEMINSVLTGKQPSDGALERAERQITLVMQQK